MAYPRHCKRAKQSILPSSPARWIASLHSQCRLDRASRSRGAMRPRFAGSLPSRNQRAQGMPGAGWHPRSRVQDALKNAHTSIQVQPEQPGIPCAMVLRLMPSSPRRRIPLASVAGELTARVARLGFANLRRLDTSHGCQDHTVLPYAASSAKTPTSQVRPTEALAKAFKRRSSARCVAHGRPPCEHLSRLTLPRPPQPAPTFVTMANAPLPGTGWPEL